MSLEERHWPYLCIIALLLVLSVVAVVEVCADATPVTNAVPNSAIAIYLDFMVSSIVNRNNKGCSALVALVGNGCASIRRTLALRWTWGSPELIRSKELYF
jgi:hypothetical protein